MLLRFRSDLVSLFLFLSVALNEKKIMCTAGDKRCICMFHRRRVFLLKKINDRNQTQYFVQDSLKSFPKWIEFAEITHWCCFEHTVCSKSVVHALPRALNDKLLLEKTSEHDFKLVIAFTIRVFVGGILHLQSFNLQKDNRWFFEESTERGRTPWRSLALPFHWICAQCEKLVEVHYVTASRLFPLNRTFFLIVLEVL